MRNETQPIQQTFAVDPEHNSLRLVVAGMFVLSVGLIFIMVNWLMPSGSINFLALIMALVGGSVLTNMLEKALKRRWPSGKTLTLSEGTLTLSQKQATLATLTLDDTVTRHRWAFEIQRRTRVPKGWYMVAMAVESGEAFVAVYTLMSPETFHSFDQHERFTLLTPKDETSDDLRLAGEQKRLREAESRRWESGVEATQSDFKTLSNYLEA